MTITENLHLKKPSYSDPVDIQDLNDNFDNIDALGVRISNLINQITENPEYAGTAELVDIRSGYDGTLHQTAGDAVRAIGYALSDLEEDLMEYVDENAVSELGLSYDETTSMLYLTNGGQIISDGIHIVSGGGGGGGGSSGNNAVLTVTNTTGWLAKTVSEGSDCSVSFTWSSLENELSTGDGTLTIKVGNVTKKTSGISQGSVSVEIGDLLAPGSNKVRLTVADAADNTKSLNFTITVVALSISSAFDTSGVFTAGESIVYSYIPTGAVDKTVYFYVDGVSTTTDSVTTSGRQQSHTLTGMSHGHHTLRVFFTAVINGETVQSNELYYDLLVVDNSSTIPVIASAFRTATASQYTTLVIPYTVYRPNELTTDITLYANNVEVNSLTVDRTEQTWSYRADTTGELTLTIVAGATVRSFVLNITETSIDVEAETDSLTLYLSSAGRSNNEATPGVWEDSARSISCTMTDFNFVSDGWVADNDGITVLRVAGDARVTIPYKPFQNDFRSTGKTIEVEFATRDILDYDATILSCMSGGVGFRLTAQWASLASEQSNISTQYKEDEHVRVSFVVEKRTENRLIFIYINGIMSGVVRYPDDDNFAQASPVNISIGASGCTTDIYCIRIYDNDLTRYQVLDNWIADTQDGATMLRRFEHNDVYDDYGSVIIEKLPSDLPYMVLSCPELPQYKGDKKTISGWYVDPQDSSKSFTFTGCQANVQGTSSAPYARKNYDLQYKNGFEMNNGSHADNYALASTVIPFNRFVLKADVASSEGANNVELVKLYCDVSPYKRREQTANSKVREGIYGFPIVVFWHNTTNDTTSLLGKYNFNLPKRAPGPYGYSGDMESWEFQNNTSNLMLFKSDYFDETLYTDPTTGDTKEIWRYDYEARFPNDEWVDYSKLQEFQSFVYSTYRAEATGDALASSVTYNGVTYTNDTAAYRLAKFKAEFGNYAEVDSFIFYYIFTELFLMVDSRAKNLFIGFSGSDTDPLLNLTIDRKAVAEPYDMDTAIGTNNEGSLVFGYSLEDTDTLQSGANVFNGQNSVLWCNLRDAFSAEIVAMYQRLRSAGTLSFANVEQRFEDHQAKWPEAIFNEDAIFKYILPLTNPDPGKEPTAVYLPMLQGSKAEQRRWWLYNRFRYMDSKWNAGDALTDIIQLRGYDKANITVTPYADIYPTVKYGSYIVSARGAHGEATTLTCPLDEVSDTEIYIYSASQLKSIGDISGLKVGLVDLSKATKLQTIKIGDSDANYSNGNLTDLTIGNNTLLQSIDVRNCPNLTASISLAGCPNVENVYFGGTAITGCTLPNGGVLKVLQLPGTITNLTVRNQTSLTTFSMPNYGSMTTLRLENSTNIPVESILTGATNLNRVRIVGMDWTSSSEANLQASITKLRACSGMDENGNNTSGAVVSGRVRVTSISPALLEEINTYFPNLVVVVNGVAQYLVRFMNTNNTLVYTMVVSEGGDAVDPVAAGYVSPPTIEGSDGVYYTFSRWQSIPTNVQSNVTVYAEYTETYRVRFLDWDGTVLETVYVASGGNASYTGSSPTRASTAQYTYSFSGWSGSTQNITQSVDLTATYSSIVRTYTVYYYNGSTLLQTKYNIAYGSSTSYTGSTPTHSNPDYVFSGFSPDGTNITGDTYCYAVFIDTAVPLIKYLKRSLTAYESNTATKVAQYAFYNYTNLQTVETSATSIETSAFQSCTNLTTVDLTSTSAITLAANAFSGDTKLAHLIIRSTSLSTMSATSALQSTMIASGNGAIYVPSDLVNTYKAASNWSTYASQIYPISAYPVTDFSTISDSWDQIFANANYATDYHVGDTKLLTVSNGSSTVNMYMQIAAFDSDPLSDNSGNAKISWICKSILTNHRMNASNTTTGGWASTEMRTWLRDTILPTLPANVRAAIKEVNKTYYDYNTTSTLTQADTIWIPSYRELGFTNYGTKEDSGVVYSGLFTGGSGGAANIKYQSNGSAHHWWLRSAYGGTGFYYVYSNGYSTLSSASGAIGVVFGFCT